MAIDLGRAIRLSVTCLDPAGAAANATTAAVTVTLPDGTTASPSVTNPPASTGQYSVDYTTVQAGRHTVRWVFTSPAYAFTDVFDVRPAAPTAIMSLADAKAQLNKSGATNDAELRDYVEAVTRAVEFFVGPVVRRTVVEDHAGGGRTLVLRQIPAVSLTSVAAVLSVGSLSYTVADLDLDAASGVVRRRDGQLLDGPVRVTYVAGRSAVPPNIMLAARMILQHLWRTQMGSQFQSRVSALDPNDYSEVLPGLGFAVPNRALQLLQPDRLPPGIA